MTAVLAALALLAASPEPPVDPTLAALFPCTPGLSVEYAVEPKAAGEKPARMIETVRGPGREANTCVLDRVTIAADGRRIEDAWAREMLPDRITNAGWIDQPLAFRTPLLVAPVEAKKRWRFNTTDFEIAEAGAPCEVPAGRFEGCVRVVERSRDGQHEASSVYAPGVGLVAYESKDRRSRATRVERPAGPEVKARPRGKNSPQTSR